MFNNSCLERIKLPENLKKAENVDNSREYLESCFYCKPTLYKSTEPYALSCVCNWNTSGSRRNWCWELIFVSGFTLYKMAVYMSLDIWKEYHFQKI